MGDECFSEHFLIGCFFQNRMFSRLSLFKQGQDSILLKTKDEYETIQ